MFDEVSQVRPVEDPGAQLGGGQLVVAPDTKQSLPTSFSDTLNDTIEDEKNLASDYDP